MSAGQSPVKSCQLCSQDSVRWENPLCADSNRAVATVYRIDMPPAIILIAPQRRSPQTLRPGVQGNEVYFVDEDGNRDDLPVDAEGGVRVLSITLGALF